MIIVLVVITMWWQGIHIMWAWPIWQWWWCWLLWWWQKTTLLDDGDDHGDGDDDDDNKPEYLLGGQPPVCFPPLWSLSPSCDPRNPFSLFQWRLPRHHHHHNCHIIIKLITTLNNIISTFDHNHNHIILWPSQSVFPFSMKTSSTSSSHKHSYFSCCEC